MAELNEVLEYLVPRVQAYVKDAERPNSGVGRRADPYELLAEVVALPLGEQGQGLRGLQASTDFLLANSVVTWNPRFMEKLYAGTNPVGVASDLLLSVLNANAHVYTASPALSVVEKFIAKKYAQLFGFNGSNAGGLTFPGGAYSNLTAMQVARAKMYPETRQHGHTRKLAVYTSAHAHYSVRKAAVVLGLGLDAVFAVPVLANGGIDAAQLANVVIKSKSQGYTPFFVNATAGTTVYGSFDDLDAVARVAAAHGAWFHVDASWGGNLVFSEQHRHKLRGSHRADSLVVNPHKMLGVPCTCSFLLLPSTETLSEANSLEAGYLFHSADASFDLADGTLGCGRRPDALKLFLAWQYYGSRGFAERVERAAALAQYLYARVCAAPHLLPLECGAPQCLQVCFWFAPRKRLAAAEPTSQTTRRIAAELHARQQFLLDFSTHETRGEFFRVVVNAPSVTEALLDELVAAVQEIGLAHADATPQPLQEAQPERPGGHEMPPADAAS